MLGRKGRKERGIERVGSHQDQKVTGRSMGSTGNKRSRSLLSHEYETFQAHIVFKTGT